MTDETATTQPAASTGRRGRKSLKFDSGPQDSLELAAATNTLAATVRYDDEKQIEEGDKLELLDAGTGERIGTARVKHTETVPVQRALDVIRDWWAEYGIQQPDTLESVLNDYYDDAIFRLTEVKAIILNPDLKPAATDGGSDLGVWRPAQKRPVEIEYAGPFTETDVIETIEGDFEVDEEYLKEHGGYVIIRGVDGELYPCALDIFRETYETDHEVSPDGE